MKRVVVGLSGGVDSSVAAYLLQQEGYEVIGMFMRNWHDESVTISDDCPWIDDSNDAMAVAQMLGIPFQTIDLSKEYKERIVDYMFAEYESGRTPNPDVLCNREIKFDTFLKAAIQLNADYVATGHYCQKTTDVIDGKEVHHLIAGADGNKDQSYFLCQLNQAQLGKALFPIGHLEKPEVRKIATELGLVTADKKDSQGLCFVGKIKLPDFLQQQLKPKQGKVIAVPADHTMYNKPLWYSYDYQNATPTELDMLSTPFEYKTTDGDVKGEHTGAHYFTIGQRRGLGIGGTTEPLFVVETDVIENVVYTGLGENHPGLNRPALFIPNDDVHWVRPDLALHPNELKEYDVRVRYRQALQKAKLYMLASGLYIVFKTLQKGITPGQFAAWYNSEGELIGSGVIQ
jgi:tRNA-specific 2-thiouridylase